MLFKYLFKFNFKLYVLKNTCCICYKVMLAYYKDKSKRVKEQERMRGVGSLNQKGKNGKS